jgi:hypothetical protein
VLDSNGNVVSSGAITNNTASIPNFVTTGSVHIQSVDSNGNQVGDDLVSPSASCAAGGYCAIGSTGPDGGIVYLVDASKNPISYHEIAPSGWAGGGSDPRSLPKDRLTPINDFNSKSTTGGGWVLPSAGEVHHAFKEGSINRRLGFRTGFFDWYWTTDSLYGCGLVVSPIIGSDDTAGCDWLWNNNFIRPIRIFSQSGTPSLVVAPQTTTTTEPPTTVAGEPETTTTVPETTTTESTTTTVVETTTTVAEPGQTTHVDGNNVVISDLVTEIGNPDTAPLVVGDQPQTLEIPAAEAKKILGSADSGILGIDISFDGVSWMPVSATSGLNASIPAGTTSYSIRVKTKSNGTKTVKRTFAKTVPANAFVAGTSNLTSDTTATADTSASGSTETTVATAPTSSSSSSSNTGMIAIIALVVAAIAGAGFALSKRNKK